MLNPASEKTNMIDTMLQFITHNNGRYDEVSGTEAVLRGGCRWIQLRMKEASKETILLTASRIRTLCDTYKATFILDDHADLVIASGADGVHLGQKDMAVDEARRLLGPKFIIGSTANTIDDMRRAQRLGADYIGLGPFRFTQTKKNLSPVLGIEGYADIMAACHTESIVTPVVAIGGIIADDIPALMATGITGIALSGALLDAENPMQETDKIIKIIKDTKK